MVSLQLSVTQRLLQTIQRELHIGLVLAGEDPAVPAELVAAVLGSLRRTPPSDLRAR